MAVAPRARGVHAWPSMDETPGSDPFAILATWHAEARAAGAREPDAMVLATATSDGQPSARVVLYKGQERGRVHFVSNYRSKKGREIGDNPKVALVFFWAEIMRQIRIEGVAEKANERDSDAYFRSRPRESQLGAWASPQSEVLDSRATLEARFREVEVRFAGGEVPRPPQWGVYEVVPATFELWISRPHRLHDRFLYGLTEAGWSAVRLSP
jgi:pyridoxamine 5'-phosphate oxidase